MCYTITIVWQVKNVYNLGIIISYGTPVQRYVIEIFMKGNNKTIISFNIYNHI